MNYKASGDPMPGYRIPWATLDALSGGQGRMLWGGEVYGHALALVPLWGKL